MDKMTFAEIKEVLNAFTLNDVHLYTTLCEMVKSYVNDDEEPDKLWFASYMLERWFEDMNDVFIDCSYWYRMVSDEELMEIWELNEEDWEEMVEEEKFIREEMIEKLGE